MKKPTTSAAQARSAILISDPTEVRQFGDDGSVLLWREAEGSAPRRGLLCVPRVCPAPDCMLVHVWLGEVDASLSCVAKTERAFEFLIDEGVKGAAARLPIGEAYANYDTRTGSVTAAEGAEKSTLVAWLVASADRDVLAHFRTPLMRRELSAGRVLTRA